MRLVGGMTKIGLILSFVYVSMGDFAEAGPRRRGRFQRFRVSQEVASRESGTESSETETYSRSSVGSIQLPQGDSTPVPQRTPSWQGSFLNPLDQMGREEGIRRIREQTEEGLRNFQRDAERFREGIRRLGEQTEQSLQRAQWENQRWQQNVGRLLGPQFSWPNMSPRFSSPPRISSPFTPSYRAPSFSTPSFSSPSFRMTPLSPSFR
jgi:hypothetical protein